MIYKLQLDFTPKQNPFFEEDINKNLVWGEIELNVLDDSGNLIQPVINMIWDVRELVEWLTTNEKSLIKEEFPEKYILEGNSIAEYRDKYYETRLADIIDDEADNILEDYSKRHCFYYGMSGTKTDNIFIGKRNNLYEVSYYFDEKNSWVYNINLPDFMLNVKELKQRFLFDDNNIINLQKLS